MYDRFSYHSITSAMPASQENAAKILRGTKIDLVGATIGRPCSCRQDFFVAGDRTPRKRGDRPYGEFVGFATVRRCRRDLKFSTRLHQRGVALPSRRKRSNSAPVGGKIVNHVPSRFVNHVPSP